MRRLARTVLAGIGALVLLLAALEVSLAATLRIRERRRLGMLPAASGSAAYRGMPWAADYWREWREACRVPERLRYTGDGVWHLAPFSGRAINVGADGLRRTSNASCSDGAPLVVMFGGSMLWGHGAPDDLTIPSLLAERYRLDGRPTCVSNHGDWGATSRSALIELLRELRSPGRKPDVVVFYAGSYDVKEALFRAAGAPGSEIEAAMRAGEIRRQGEDGLFSGSALARVLRPAPRHAAPRRLSAAAVEEAGKEAVRVVAEIQRSVEALASAYGFQPLFVWHPYVLSGEKPRTPEEEVIVREVDNSFPDIAAAIRSAYRGVHERRAPGFYDLSDVFAASRETLFIDAGHLNPAGNRIVADRLYEILVSRPGPPAGVP